MKRALIVASVASMIDQFTIPSIMLLKELGYKVDVAANFDDGGSISAERSAALISHLESIEVAVVNAPIPRRIFAIGSIMRSFKLLKRISKENEYDLVHCHSPIGGAITRLAVHGARKKGTRVIYTAHGFHFYKGAPIKNWLLFYPVEKFCARLTDVLITINEEDFAFAKRKLRAKRIEHLPGVGVDVDSFSALKIDAAEKKRSIGVPEHARVILSVGELNENKNHETVIRAIAGLDDNTIHYVIAGKGALRDKLNELARELGIGERVHLLGYREDVTELYGTADLFVHPSYREGLPVSVMEAMASGLAVVASGIRGNVDLVGSEGGILLCPTDVDGFASAVSSLLADEVELKKMGDCNRAAAEKYSFDAVKIKLLKIYG